MKNKIYLFIYITVFTVLLTSCAGAGGSNSVDAESYSASGKRIVVSVNRGNGRNAVQSRSLVTDNPLFSANKKYIAEVTLTGAGGYRSTKETCVFIDGSNTVNVEFDHVPYGDISATVTVMSRYHRVYTGSQSGELDGESVNMVIELEDNGFDYSGVSTGDIVYKSGGWISEFDWDPTNDFTDADVYNYFIALDFDDAKYIVSCSFEAAPHGNALAGLGSWNGAIPEDAAGKEDGWVFPSEDMVKAIAGGPVPGGLHEAFLKGWLKFKGVAYPLPEGASIPENTTYATSGGNEVDACWTSDAPYASGGSPQYAYTNLTYGDSGYKQDSMSAYYFGVCLLYQ